jgi:hypothetical protein
MAHFAKLNDKNQVIEVHVVSNAALNPNDEETSGINFLIEWSGGYTNWKQTSYNGKIRYNYCGIGWLYDETADAFIAPRPTCGHEELMLNTDFKWVCQGCNLDAKKLLNGN